MSTPPKSIGKVLVIEKDPDQISLLETLFTEHKFAESIEFTPDFQEGLTYLKVAHESGPKEIPDLVIISTDQFDEHTWEFLDAFSAECTKHRSKTCVCILSSSLSPEDRKRAMNYSFVVEYFPRSLKNSHLEYLTRFYNSRINLFEYRRLPS